MTARRRLAAFRRITAADIDALTPVVRQALQRLVGGVDGFQAVYRADLDRFVRDIFSWAPGAGPTRYQRDILQHIPRARLRPRAARGRQDDARRVGPPLVRAHTRWIGLEGDRDRLRVAATQRLLVARSEEVGGAPAMGSDRAPALHGRGVGVPVVEIADGPRDHRGVRYPRLH